MKIQAIEITNRGQRQSCFCTNIGTGPAGHCPMAGELTGIAEEFAELSGAILLAEGGMGKSTLMRQLKNQFPDGQANLVELGRYSGDPAGLREHSCSFVQTYAKDSASAIIFDELDEAADLSGAVSRLIHDIPKTSTIWIASRDVAAIRSIQSELPQLKTYNLAPLSEQNIRDLAYDNDLALLSHFFKM